MKIKQIELAGFKSFADRSLFQLHNGVTCIVGPNGCGKSNIVDSFRWVLGEQSAKSLRGDKMDELIFQGSASKKQKGMAEVTLVLSQSNASSFEDKPENGNGGASGNETSVDEITVSRRLYRSGESEYLINKRQCRLKDIKDIFLDTGLDVKSYSILDQGKITEIINTKPLDRRFLIEEIAGVMKYKIRKAEALSKLESSKQNLQRINDIVYEVKRQINSLDRQVKKAERYKRLTEESKGVELRIVKREHLGLSSTLKSLLSDLELLRETDSLKRGELSTLETRIETKRLEITNKEKALAELEDTLHGKEREVADSEQKIAVLKTIIENRKADISRLIKLQDEIEIKKEELFKKISELDIAEASLSSGMENISSEIAGKKDQASEIEIAISTKEAEIENRRKDLFRTSELLSNNKNDLHKLQSSFENLKYKESHALKDMDTIKAGTDDLTRSIREAEEFISKGADEHSRLRAERDLLTAGIAKLEDEIGSNKAMLSLERETLASNLSRLNSLKELIIDRSLSDFLSETKGNLHFAGTVLSDVVNADKDFEKVIEAALSDKINSLIIDNIEDVMSALSIVRDKRLGRTAILYTGYRTQDPGLDRNDDGLSVILNGLKEDSSSVPGNSSLIGRASDFITFENAEAKNIADKILSNTYIVKDLQSAIELRESRLFNGSTLVTLDGDVIESDGIIFSGQGKEILKRKKEIKELLLSTEEQQVRIVDIERELTVNADKQTQQKEALRNIETSIVEVERDLSLSNQALTTQREELERMTKRISFLETELSTISMEKESLEKLIGSKNTEILQFESEKDAISDGITILQQALAETRADYEDARAYLTEMKMTLTSYRERIESLQKERGNITDTIAENENKKDLSIKEVRESEEKITESLSELQRLDETIKTLITAADMMKKERADQKEIIDTENQSLISESSSLKIIRQDIDAISQELSGANSKAIENRLKIENIENIIRQKYGLEISSENIELEGTAPSEDEERFNQLSGKVRELGPVNLGTIEEYEELKTRYDFLTKQQQDLTMSIAELEEAISRINASTKRKLREAYDSLRTKFMEVFSVLFGGGKADIVLTDEENILESGIDIIAQPPGKKLQNLNLLSGGEKALTSLALLFAGFLLKPSPLCILDEVDAPLDESNTVRFAKMIKELSNETQFIVITHNRTTMEVSDHLYGITMEEPGISKAISLQFAEVENIG